ncbi:MAG: mechanosensitive ion channel family protein [Dehalococcoidia bacterium]
MPELTWADVVAWLYDHGPTILIIVVVGALLWLGLNRILPPIVRRAVAQTRHKESKEGMEKRTNTLLFVFKGVGRVFIVIVGLMMILSEVGIPIAPVLAGFGVVGIAIGFGAQYLIRDIISGTFIILENQYRVGDVARVADVTGTVEEVGLRKTVLRDLDGIVHHVPNGEIRVSSNFTRHFARVNLDVSVSYGTDLDHAISVINRVGNELAEDTEWRQVIRTPPQAVRVNKLGDSGIDIKIVGEVKPMQQWATMGQLRLRLKKAFDAEGIEIPWPHTKVYFGNPLPDSAKKEDPPPQA